MEKIPTAEDFLSKNIDYVLEKDCKEDVEYAMIKFTKLHVQAALKAAEYATEEYDFSVEIKNCYPLYKIK